MCKVSVLTPIYNTDHQQLQEMIESILSQTYTDFEFIILNDSPENKELEVIVKNFSDPRIKYYSNEHNLGIAESRNRLIALAKGEYLAVCDHDDISLPNRLEDQVNILDLHPEIGVVSGLCEVIGGGSHCFQKHPEFDFEIRTKLTLGCYIAHPACMIRKSLLKDNNIKYKSAYSPAEDYKLFLDLIDITQFYNIQKVILKYRSYDSNTSVKQQNRMEYISDLILSEAQQNHPELYNLALQRFSVKLYKVKFFNLFSLATVYSDKILIFNCIPMFRFKRYH